LSELVSKTTTAGEKLRQQSLQSATSVAAAARRERYSARYSSSSNSSSSSKRGGTTGSSSDSNGASVTTTATASAAAVTAAVPTCSEPLGDSWRCAERDLTVRNRYLSKIAQVLACSTKPRPVGATRFSSTVPAAARHLEAELYDSAASFTVMIVHGS
jgi:hypothetical protein